MAYKFQIGRTRLSGSTLFENGLQISGSGEVQEDLNIVKAGGLQLQGASVTTTAAELNVLDQLAQGSILIGDGDGPAAITDIKTDGQILVGNGTTAASVAVSGDATLANTGAVTLASAQTNVQSVLNASLVVGRDADNDIDFSTDNQITFRAEGADQVVLKDGALEPVTDSDVDLGTNAKRFKDAFLDSATVTGQVSGLHLSASHGLSGSSLTLGGTAVSSTAAELNVLDGLARGSIILGTSAGTATLDAKTDGQILVGDGTDVASVAVSGDATLSNAGAVTLASAQTNVGSLLNASLVVGRDADNDIDFSVDNQIKFRAEGADQVVLKDGVLEPVTDSDVDLGTNAKRFKDAFLDSATITGALAAAGAVSGSALSSSGPGLFGGAVDIKGNLDVKGSVVNLSGVGTAGLDAADFFVSLDSATRDMQLRTRSDVADDFAGAGLGASSGVLAVANATNGGIGVQADDIKVDLNDLAAADINVAADSIAIIDADDSNATRKESIADLADAMAGTGVTATNGVFSVDTSGGDRISSAAIADGGTAAAGINHFATITGSVGVALPASPAVGDLVIIKAGDMGPGMEIVVARQGSHLIDGQITQVLESPFAALSCVYVSGSTGNDWRIV